MVRMKGFAYILLFVLIVTVSVFAEDSTPSDLPVVPVSAGALKQMNELQREMNELDLQFRLITALDENELGVKASLYDLRSDMNPPSYVPKKPAQTREPAK